MSEGDRDKRPSDVPAGSDRRGDDRLLACFPAYVERPDGELRTTLIRDLSVSGALLLVRTKLEVGDKVALQLFISPKLEEYRTAKGKILRIEPLSDEEVGLWSRRVAVQFDEPLTIYEAEILALKARQDQQKELLG